MDTHLLDELIKNFLGEDVGRGDLTSEAIFAEDQVGVARLVAREPFLVAGAASIAARVFVIQNPLIRCSEAVADGTWVEPGRALLTVTGPVIDLLKAERLALNLLQRLSGIATLTARFVGRVEGYAVRITDTRKTTPGLRVLEKYAVRVGGGHNHRFNLTDGVLIKDNHIAACGSITQAVARVREKVPHTLRIEVETENLQQVAECLDCQVDIIMLDNMAPELMAEAVRMVDGHCLVEASGGINLDTVSAVAASGVDIISVGALTHSALACDIGMDWQ
jgi:nicotinate-nucleotide pyrophosphorylase (carboxylating)